MQDQVTTTIRLPRAQLKRLKLKAVQEGRSVAEVVRDSIGLYLDADAHPAARYEDDAFFKMGPYGGSGGARGAEDHDEVLYGGDQPL